FHVTGVQTCALPIFFETSHGQSSFLFSWSLKEPHFVVGAHHDHIQCRGREIPIYRFALGYITDALSYLIKFLIKNLDIAAIIIKQNQNRYDQGGIYRSDRT